MAWEHIVRRGESIPSTPTKKNKRGYVRMAWEHIVRRGESIPSTPTKLNIEAGVV